MTPKILLELYSDDMTPEKYVKLDYINYLFFYVISFIFVVFLLELCSSDLFLSS